MSKIRILGLAAFSAMTIAAYADVIPTLSSIIGSGGDFTWNYSANVTVDQRVEHGDFFTIYDFGTFVSGSNTQPTDWMFSSALLGRTPPLVSPHDDPAILNLTWTYIGKTPIIGPADLGIFSVDNNTNQQQTGDFAAIMSETYRCQFPRCPRCFPFSVCAAPACSPSFRHFSAGDRPTANLQLCLLKGHRK